MLDRRTQSQIAFPQVTLYAAKICSDVIMVQSWFSDGHV